MRAVSDHGPPLRAGWVGYGRCPCHSQFYWGAKLMLLCTCDGTVTGFCLASPKLYGNAPKPARCSGTSR